MAKHVLVVDDEKLLLQALVDKLTRAGFVVSTASNGKEGLEAALTSQPDLIVLDIVMPLMDGLTMLTKLRNDHWGKSAKVIILTNLYDPRKITPSLLSTVSDSIVKSDCPLSKVVERIEKVVLK
ncbi:MAG: response regulator [bacterium]